jgi:PTS system galactitol-specific IIC component
LTAPAVQKAANTPGISTPHVFSTVFALPAALLNRGIDALPGIRSAEVDPERVRTRVGALGEPVVLGVAVGGLVALAAYAGVGPWVEWAARVFQVAVTVAAVMVIMPRVVSLIMEGLIPLSEAARDFLRRRTGSRDTLIGVDVAVLTGHPTAVAAGLLLVPITVVLALVLPGNRVLPLGDLPTLPFVIALVVPVVRGNLFRTVLVGTLLMIPTLYIMNATAGLHSQITDASSLTLLGDGPNATSLAGGGSWLPSLFAFVSRSYWVGHAAIAGTLVIAWIGFRRNKEKWYRAAGAYDT